MYMFYVGFEDGSFVGYYGDGLAGRGDNHLAYTEVNSPRCAWTYGASCGGADADYCTAGYPGTNPACREYFDTDW